MLLLALCCAQASHAQRVVTKFRNTQARMLDVTSNAYVRPVVVELEVEPVKVDTTYFLTKEEAEIEMSGDIPNIRSWGVYRASADYDCDVIVAATFILESTEKGGYSLTITGFPGRYKNWATATSEDMEWIRVEKIASTAEKDKIAPIIK